MTEPAPAEDKSIRPFTLNIPEAQLTDLHQRLAAQSYDKFAGRPHTPIQNEHQKRRVARRYHTLLALQICNSKIDNY